MNPRSNIWLNADAFWRPLRDRAAIGQFRSLAALWLSVLPDATTSLFHQRNVGRVLRSPRHTRGRRVASSRGREPRPGRCTPLRPGDLRNDGGGVAAFGADRHAARLDGALRPDD